MAEESGLFGELKRRHVWRAAAAYAVTGWLVVQIATQVFPFFNIPDWAVRLVVIVIVIGFPVALALAWAYEITPGGIRRTEPADSPNAQPEHQSRQVARKLNAITIAILIVAVALLGWRVLVLRHAHSVAHSSSAAAATTANSATNATTAGLPAAAPAPQDSTPGAFNPPKDTLVVLPFRNLGGDPGQQYFSDGITEELTDALGQNPALRVTAWDTSSRFRDTSASATDIGKSLNVANVLLGTIEREGDEVRINAELVSAVTGLQLWSAHYDEAFSHIFKVQDQVSAAIAGALQVKFAQADLPTGGTTNPEAHDLVLKGRALLEQHDVAGYATAQRDFEQAISRDPAYANAYAALAGALLDRADYADLSLQDAAPKARALAHKALKLDPRNTDALTILGNLDLNDLNLEQAQDAYRQALASDPSNAHTHVDYALTLPVQAGLTEIREAIALDPRSWVAHMNLALGYAYLGDYKEMRAASQAILQLSPRNVDGAFLLAFANQQLRQDQAAVNAFRATRPSTPLDELFMQAGQLTYQARLNPDLRGQASAAVERLGHKRLSPYSQRNLIQLYLALGETAPALQLLESLCPSYPIACSDLAAFPVFQPLRNIPRFEKLAARYTTKPLLPSADSRDPVDSMTPRGTSAQLPDSSPRRTPGPSPLSYRGPKQRFSLHWMPAFGGMTSKSEPH